MTCESCGELDRVAIIRKVGDEPQRIVICGHCLVVTLKDITKQDWVSQYILWQANSKLGKEIQEMKRNGKL